MILTGDCREVLATLPESSVHCCVTSPPYFGLRSYLPEGHPNKAREIGRERLHDCLGWATGHPCGACFVCAMLQVFRAVRRVLRDDGVCWLNLGDSYAGSGRGGNSGGPASTLEGGLETQARAPRERSSAHAVSDHQRRHTPTVRGSRLPAGFHRDHVDAGQMGRAWVPPPAGLKQKDLIGIPWRVALALQADGWFLRQDVIWQKPNPMPESVTDRCTKAHEYLFMLAKSERYHFDQAAISEPAACPEGPRNKRAYQVAGERRGDNSNLGGAVHKIGPRPTRNRRSVWEIPTQPYKEAHFATFPERLPELCILATCPPGGTVLDPFFGSGTTGQVAQRLGRNWIGIELNDGYVPLAEDRAGQEQPGLALGAA